MIPTRSASIFAPCPLALQFLNNLMFPQKKAQYCAVLNKTLVILRDQHRSNPLELLRAAVSTSAPLLRVASSKRGSKSIQTPFPVSDHKRNRIAIKWIINAADKRKGPLEQRLAEELSAVLDGSSTVLANRANLHKNALASRSNLILQDRKKM